MPSHRHIWQKLSQSGSRLDIIRFRTSLKTRIELKIVFGSVLLLRQVLPAKSSAIRRKRIREDNLRSM